MTSHSVFLFAFVVAFCTANHSTASAEDASGSEWPARVDGKYVPKTFRFKPSFIEYRELSTRVPCTLVVFGIKDKDIPADYFTVRYRLGSDEEKRIRRAIVEAQDGYVTVVAIWVNGPTPKDEWQGAAEYWVEGRGLVGGLTDGGTK